MSTRLGSLMTASRRPRQSGSSVTTATFAVASVTLRAPDSPMAITRPSSWRSRSFRSTATMSMTLRESASLAGRLTDSRTACSAQARVAAAQLRQAADVGGGVVDALGGLRVVARCGCRCRAAGPAGWLRAASRHRHADLDRRRGAQVGCRRHRRDVRGVQDVGAGARGPGALRRHEDGDRRRRGQDVLDDRAHRRVEPAGGVHLQHDELCVLVRRPFQRAGDVLCRRRTDGAIDAQHDHRRSGRSVRIAHPGQRRKQRERASEPDTGFHSDLRPPDPRGGIHLQETHGSDGQPKRTPARRSKLESP